MCQISKIAKSGKSLNPILQFAEVRYGLLRLDGLGMVLNLLFYSELYCINNTTMQIGQYVEGQQKPRSPVGECIFNTI